MLLNVLAHELARASSGASLTTDDDVLLCPRCRAPAHQGLVCGGGTDCRLGLLAFRDPFGIRPLCMGRGADGTVMLASESVALEGTLHRLERDIAPGEAVFMQLDGTVQTRQCAQQPRLYPCVFEYVYLARPDSIMDGISVYQARLNMGETLAKRVISTVPPSQIDAIIPIPDPAAPAPCSWRSSGPALPRRFCEEPNVGRTFIMPGQGTRKKSVRQKFNAIASELGQARAVGGRLHRARHHLQEIVQMARDAGAVKVYLASAAAGAPPQRLRHRHAHQRRTGGARPHFRGRNPPGDRRRRADLPGRGGHEAGRGQDQPGVQGFEASCFDGCTSPATSPTLVTALNEAPARGEGTTKTRRACRCPTPRVALPGDGKK